MRVRRYVAATMQEAVAQVRADFGSEAVILQTRRLRARGLWGLLGRRRVEVIAALDREPRRGVQPSLPQPAPPPRLNAAPAQPPPAGAGRPGFTPLAERLAAGVRSPAAAVPQLRQPRPQARPEAQDRLERLRTRLIELGLPVAEIDEIVAEVRSLNPFAEGWAGDGTEAPLGEALVRSLAARISTVEPWQLSDPPYFAALVGPTGVGKTTTVAKLAANYAIATGKQVAMIAADTYRIGAVDQLREYADLIGVPLEVAETPEQMAGAVRRFSDCDLVLVDTVGRSQRDEQQIAELQRLVRVLPRGECHLVLSATTRLPDLADIVERFSVLNPATVMVTKIDETTSPVTVFNAARLSGCPLSFVTAGQRVPEDIEVAEPVTVARAIIGELA